jgi:hypothetical protein
VAYNAGIFVIIQPGPAQALVGDVKTQRFNQVEFGSRVGTEANDVAGVGRYFGLVKDDGEHSDWREVLKVAD